jgi:hypothetical protein
LWAGRSVPLGTARIPFEEYLSVCVLADRRREGSVEVLVDVPLRPQAPDVPSLSLVLFG